MKLDDLERKCALKDVLSYKLQRCDEDNNILPAAPNGTSRRQRARLNAPLVADDRGEITLAIEYKSPFAKVRFFGCCGGQRTRVDVARCSLRALSTAKRSLKRRRSSWATQMSCTAFCCPICWCDSQARRGCSPLLRFPVCQDVANEALLSDSATWLLSEFALRYGVPPLYRHLVYLEKLETIFDCTNASSKRCVFAALRV